MRSESKISREENRGGRRESSPPKVETWKIIDAPSKTESANLLMEELFGDVLVKLNKLIEKDKKKLKKALRKRHGSSKT